MRSLSIFSANKDGYSVANIYVSHKKQIFINIHRLVAETFIPNHSNLPEVHHKDFNKTNNATSNLEWISVTDHHSIHRNERKANNVSINVGECHGKSRLSEKNVLYILNNYKPKDSMFSTTSLASMFNVKKSTISMIVTNKRWTHIDRKNISNLHIIQ